MDKTVLPSKIIDGKFSGSQNIIKKNAQQGNERSYPLRSENRMESNILISERPEFEEMQESKQLNVAQKLNSLDWN